MMSTITDKIAALALLAAMIWIIMIGLPGCSTMQQAVDRVTGNRITLLRHQADDAREVIMAVVDDRHLQELRSNLRDIDPATLGRDDSKLWLAYMRVRQVVVETYAAKGERVPSALRRFDATARDIHERLPAIVKTAQDARRIIAVYRFLAL